jgi:hypothetical protein
VRRIKHKIISFSALFLLMLITGVFWGTWFTLTRSIEDFSPEEFIHIGKTIIANVAMPMRIIVPSGIILMFLALWFTKNKRTTSFILGVFSFALIIAVLLITLTVLVPIDNDINEWTASTIPSNWSEIRQKWDLFHSIRTFASLTSFACFSIFILANDKSGN